MIKYIYITIHSVKIIYYNYMIIFLWTTKISIKAFTEEELCEGCLISYAYGILLSM